MKLNSKVRKISGLFMIMLVVGMILVTPAMACPAGTDCGNNPSAGNVGEPIELTGEEKDKLLNMALENDEVIKYQKDLENEGFEQKDVKTYTIPVTLEDKSVIDVQIVTFQFESDDQDTKGISFACNKQTGETVVARGYWACAECLAVLVAGGIGCTTVCVSPAGALTLGTLCIGCLGATQTLAACPCFKCGCAAGDSDGCWWANYLGCS